MDPVFTGDADGPGPDLALVEITGGWEMCRRWAWRRWIETARRVTR